MIAEDAYAEITLRVSTHAKECLAIIDAILNHKVPRSDKVVVSYRIHEPSEPVSCDTEVAESVGADTFVAAYFTDIPYLIGDHKALLVGPGSITVAHADNEFVNKKELVAHVQLYEAIVERLLEKL